MIEYSTRFLSEIAAPPLAPLDQPIDVDHLARMTLGDPLLEREVLQLYDRQATMLLARMRQTIPAVIAASAHTIKGSSRGIGAWRVAREAEAVELAATENGAQLQGAIDRLALSINEARLVITDLLRAH
jgi:HPt (histidine-containing phosphotransfer) domain-containing protein